MLRSFLAISSQGGDIMPKVVLFPVIKRDSENSPPSTDKSEGWAEVFNLDDLKIPSIYYLHKTPIAMSGRKSACECCREPRAGIKLTWFVEKKVIDNYSRMYSLEYRELRPPITTYCCRSCISKGNALARNRLRKRAEKNGTWVPPEE